MFVENKFVWVEKDSQNLVHRAEAVRKDGCRFWEKSKLSKSRGQGNKFCPVDCIGGTLAAWVNLESENGMGWVVDANTAPCNGDGWVYW